MKAIFFFDMDGVLAKWNEHASEEETHQPGYFLEREVELSVIALVRRLKDEGADVRVLSSVYEDDHSAAEKRQWLMSVGLGDVDPVFVPYGHDKFRYVCPKEDEALILIDDYGKNLTNWERVGYIPVKFFNGVNNKPRLSVVDGEIKVHTDTWSGFSIDHRMSVDQMHVILAAVAAAA